MRSACCWAKLSGAQGLRGGALTFAFTFTLNFTLACAHQTSAPVLADVPLAPSRDVAAERSGATESLAGRFNATESLAGRTSATPAWCSQQETTSWTHLRANISPSEPKQVGGPRPERGIVVAALSRKHPDYYFHWVRDSSHVMAVLARAWERRRPYVSGQQVIADFRDFLNLSKRLQHSNSVWGLGEVRFTVTAEPDTLPWSRPQYDGPPLRALAVLNFLSAFRGQLDETLVKLAQDVLVTDLNFTAENYKLRGFDLWEERRAENYHTRLAQLAAVEDGATEVRRADFGWPAGSAATRARTKPETAKMANAARDLRRELNEHWDPVGKYYRAQMTIEMTDGYSKKHTNLDSAVVIAVIDADLRRGRHSVLDPRVQATVVALEDLFRTAYPINRTGPGLAYGRYQDDAYFGGNPWYLITAYYAQFYYRLAARLEAGEFLVVDRDNDEFLRRHLSPAVLARVKLGNHMNAPLRESVVESFVAVADAIMDRLAQVTPRDGQLYEQFDRTTGAPVSSRGIGWAHAEFLNAVFDRERLKTRP